MSANFSLEVNDFLSELIEENNRLLSELRFAQKLFELIDKYKNLVENRVKSCDNCRQNEDLRQEFNQLETTFGEDLTRAKTQHLSLITEAENRLKPFRSVSGHECRSSGYAAVRRVKQKYRTLRTDRQCLKCDICGQHFSEEYYLSAHMKTIHSSLPSDQHYFGCDRTDCRLGDRVLRTRTIVNKHKKQIQSHEREDIVGEEDSIGTNGLIERKKNVSDGRKETSIDSIESIISLNDQTLNPKNQDFTCNECSKTYKKRKHLFRHHKQSHPSSDRNDLRMSLFLMLEEEQQNSETSLNISVNSGQGLVQKKKRRFRPKPFGCNYCKSSFSEEYILLLHVQTIHNSNSDQTYCCDINECDYKTKHLTNFKNHRKRHIGEKPIACLWPSCEQMFVSSEDMNKHLHKHQDVRNYLCVWPGCASSFKTGQDLQRHTQVHTSAPDQCPCEWPDCPKRFRTPRQMRRHVLVVHKGHRKFVCHWPQCDKQFADKSNMYKHLRSTHKKS